MTGCKVELSTTARDQLKYLEDGPRQDARALIKKLEEDPTSIPGAVKMKGYANKYRARFHHKRYRMVYEIYKPSKTVFVTRMKPRPTAYQGMKRPDGPPKRP